MSPPPSPAQCPKATSEGAAPPVQDSAPAAAEVEAEAAAPTPLRLHRNPCPRLPDFHFLRQEQPPRFPRQLHRSPHPNPPCRTTAGAAEVEAAEAWAEAEMTAEPARPNPANHSPQALLHLQQRGRGEEEWGLQEEQFLEPPRHYRQQPHR